MNVIVRPVESPAGLLQVAPGETTPRPCHVELTDGGELTATATLDGWPADRPVAVQHWPLPRPIPADIANALLTELVPLAETVLAGLAAGEHAEGLTEAAQQASRQIQERCQQVECDVVLADAGEVVRCLADPDDQSLLSAAQFARDWLVLDAHTTDTALAGVVERADQTLREDMHVVSDQTADAIRQLRGVLHVHEVAAAVELGPANQDEKLITATVARIGPIDDLSPDAVRDVVQQTITRARAQAIEDAVTAAVAAQRAITDAEADHKARMGELKATLQARVETAIGAGRPVGVLSDDLQLTRQRIAQIRNGTR